MTAATAPGAPWAGRIAAWLLALPLLLALLMLAASWDSPQPQAWAHLREHLLTAVAIDTCLLLLGVGLGVSLLGVGLAWLSAHCDYPGRRWLDWALVLPLAMPTYVVAFAWVGLLDYGGPLQTHWRAWTGLHSALFDGRGLVGAVLLLSLVLYPYVYLLARAAFLRQGAAGFDAARSLGRTPWSAFFLVALPLVRPAWIAGLTLALLETLADFGAVSILGVDTFTVAIYKTWFGLFALPAAAQLSTLLLLAVAAVLIAERLLRGAGRRAQRDLRPMPRLRLAGPAAAFATAAAGAVVTLGFVVPAVSLLSWLPAGALLRTGLIATAGNTLLLGLLVATAVLVAAGALAGLEYRRPRDRWRRAAGFVATMGYAVPGTVLAVAVMVLLVRAERFGAQTLGIDLALSASIAGVLLALTLRFLRIGHSAIEAGLAQLRPALLESARLLGADRWRRFRRVVFPQLRPSLLAAVLLVLVETMKEMPATLMLRPFGWDTLAVRVYGYTAEGLWAEAAAPALVLVAVGLLPVWWLVRAQR